MLAARGVTIAGGVRHGVAPDGASEVAHVDSAPLSDIVGEMLTSSDNYTAEELVRDIAAHGRQRTRDDRKRDTRLVLREMTALGIPTEGLVMHDGSGLAPDDRATCATLLKIIDLASTAEVRGGRRGACDRGPNGHARRPVRRWPARGQAPRPRPVPSPASSVWSGSSTGPTDLHFAFVANGDFGVGRGEQLQADVAAAVGSTPDLAAPRGLVPAP